MRIALGADHGGVGLKRLIHESLEAQGHFVTNVGTDGDVAVDYPDFSHKVAAAVANAIYHAIGRRITELPMSPPKVLAALDSGRGG